MAAKSEALRVGGVRFAVASKDGLLVDQHFGHADKLLIYQAHDQCVSFLETRRIAPYCSGDCEPADDAGSIFEQVGDCSYLLCLRIGCTPAERLTALGIRPIEAYGEIGAIIKAVLKCEGENEIYRFAWRS